jgi:hypothetical protein
MAELMVDRPELQRQCRLEVVLRNDRLPDWITQLHRRGLLCDRVVDV